MRRLLLPPVMIALASVPAWAEPTRDAVMEGAARCDGIADNRVWLDCFYGSAQPMRALLNLPPANPAQVRLVPPPGAEPRRVASARQKPQQSGGIWADLVASTKPEASNVAMTRYEFSRSGAVTVSLADGQVWRQLESDLTRARRQQKIMSAIKDKVTSFETFVRLPWVSWAAPKAIRSDMSGPVKRTVAGC